VMKIYDGKTVSEADLNTIMRNGVPAVVKSMAEDGSLTVYLKTIQITDYNLKDGFEAVVSEYTPVQMEVKEIVPAQYTEGTVVAGDVSSILRRKILFLLLRKHLSLLPKELRFYLICQKLRFIIPEKAMSLPIQ
jgi:hypothetical protein